MIYDGLISGLAAAMTVLLVWLHLLAAISWIGGTIFLSVVLVPVLKREPFALQRALLFRTITRRFRAVVWGAIAVLLFAGLPLLHQRGIPIADPSGWPMVLAAKLGLVTILLLLTLTHDLILGPRVGKILQLPTESELDSITPWFCGLPGSLASRSFSRWSSCLPPFYLCGPNKTLKRSPFSPARPWRILHPPALKLPRQPLCPRTSLSPCGALDIREAQATGWLP